MEKEYVSLGFKLCETWYKRSLFGDSPIDYDESDIFTSERYGWNTIEQEIQSKCNHIFDMVIDVSKRKVWVSFINSNCIHEYYIKEIVTWF